MNEFKVLTAGFVLAATRASVAGAQEHQDINEAGSPQTPKSTINSAWTGV